MGVRVAQLKCHFAVAVIEDEVVGVYDDGRSIEMETGRGQVHPRCNLLLVQSAFGCLWENIVPQMVGQIRYGGIAAASFNALRLLGFSLQSHVFELFDGYDKTHSNDLLKMKKT